MNTEFNREDINIVYLDAHGSTCTSDGEVEIVSIPYNCIVLATCDDNMYLETMETISYNNIKLISDYYRRYRRPRERTTLTQVLDILNHVKIFTEGTTSRARYCAFYDNMPNIRFRKTVVPRNDATLYYHFTGSCDENMRQKAFQLNGTRDLVELMSRASSDPSHFYFMVVNACRTLKTSFGMDNELLAVNTPRLNLNDDANFKEHCNFIRDRINGYFTTVYGGGGKPRNVMKQRIVMKQNGKQYVVRTDARSERYINFNKQRCYLSTIRNKYALVLDENCK